MACGSGFSRDFFFQNISRLKPLPQLAIFFIFTSIPAFADYQTGLDAYNVHDYTTALSEWKQVASQPPEQENLAIYRESLYAIGMLYWQGEGVAQDYGVSAVWLKQAADINHPGAQTKLGYLYTTGQGVPQNYAEAHKWFEMAAAQGDPDAQNNLAILKTLSLPETMSVTAETDPLPAVKTTPVHDAGEAWILAQQPGYYTIQVIALSAPDKLQTFISENPDWAPFSIYRQTRYEQPLWVLVQGVYADVEAARAARDAFPAGFQKRKDLWIRQFEMVQRLIE